MKIIITKDYETMSQVAADIVEQQIANQNNLVLGLATGTTPVAFYKALCLRHREGRIDFAGVTTFNLDEYVGLSADSPQSYHHYMREHLFGQINIDPNKTHIPNGDAVDHLAECRAYEDKIRLAGGIDLQILGIGQNGHIGFNEPGQSFNSRTGVVALADQTVKVNAVNFGSEELVPKTAFSMGIRSIMSAKKIVLMASGSHKALAVEESVKGRIREAFPSTVLQLHPEVTLVIDEAAAENILNLEEAQYGISKSYA